MTILRTFSKMLDIIILLEIYRNRPGPSAMVVTASGLCPLDKAMTSSRLRLMPGLKE
jgi:hypothetical protein